MKFVNLLTEVVESIKDDSNDTVSLAELAEIATNAMSEFEAELERYNQVLNDIYESGTKLNEHEDSVREALGILGNGD